MSRQTLTYVVTILATLGLAAAIVSFSLPFDARAEAPDWASIWTMRWTAVGSVATVSSMIAIIVTAFYAARAIETTTEIEKSKRAAELINSYHSREIVGAQLRVLSIAPEDYSAAASLNDYNLIAGFLEECAVTYFAGLVNKEMLLNTLDYAVNNAWLVAHFRLIPILQGHGAWTDMAQSDRLRDVCRDHLLARVAPETQAMIVAEENLFKSSVNVVHK